MRYAVIMAGGGGTRLWPASRRKKPKQLLPLGAQPGETLLGSAVRRLAPLIADARVIVVTAGTLLGDVAALLPAVPAGNLLGEPVGRNTAAAIGLAAVHLLHRDPDAVLCALPADHHIGDEARFRDVVDHAFRLAEQKDAIVTIGLAPSRPETGFGYLELGAPLAGDPAARAVTRFIEKPSRAAAEGYVKGGDHLWNGGMFFLRAARVMTELATHMPATHAGLTRIAAALAADGLAGAAAETERVYPSLPSVSIDHGVMEKSDDLLVLPGDFGWNDVGAWPALADYRPTDPAGNVVSAGAAILIDARDNVVVADAHKLVALIGVEGLVVVQAGDALLVMPRERAQDVKEIVAELQRRGLEEFL